VHERLHGAGGRSANNGADRHGRRWHRCCSNARGNAGVVGIRRGRGGVRVAGSDAGRIRVRSRGCRVRRGHAGTDRRANYEASRSSSARIARPAAAVVATRSVIRDRRGRVVRIGGRGWIVRRRRVVCRSVGGSSVWRSVDCTRAICARGASPVDITVSCTLPVGTRGASPVDIVVSGALPVSARGSSPIGIGVGCALPVAARSASPIGIGVRR
jgi:hypothetical protein